MENKGEYFLGQLTLYQYDKNKIKCDYSIIPITINCNKLPLTAKSGVSEEVIELKNYTFSKEFEEMVYSGICRNLEDHFPYYIGEKFEKKKEGDAKKVSVIYKTDDLEKDDVLFRKDLMKRFNSYFIFARKYKKFLKKKIKLNQL